MTERPIPAPAGATDLAADAGVQLLQLAVRLYAAGGDPAAWREALKASSQWLGCTGLLDLPADGQALEPDALDALAGRVTHCAGYGSCGSGPDDPLRQARCAALAPHLHEAAKAARNALQATFFEQLPPVWILDRSGRVQDCNTAAKAVVAGAGTLSVVDGMLVPGVPGGGARLRRMLADLDSEALFSWPDEHSEERALILRPLPTGKGVAATLRPEPPDAAKLAAMLARRLNLTPRQSDLAAFLLVGDSLSEAARTMGISRHTANEHLVGIQDHVGAPDRKALFHALRRATTG